MKKVLIAVLVLFALCAAIGGMTSEAEAKSYRINIATATTGGAYYPIGNAMAQIWSRNLEDVRRASAQSTAGTPQNVELMKDGEVQIAKKIETDMRYPGRIKVTIIRETRIVEYAR